ncbi:MAG: hydrogenobyrinic acid a,c-diamide synthase (glutamine-hydrolyzing) [Deltaproteobacteria bacterium]|nr:hydrogenobyrinic acid a,c-diamide synthase (glutamine-hydrolyzing) [Deltaproteobacteria bacterium]
MVNVPPRIVLAGLRGGSGKTLLTVGLTSLLHERGYSVSPFKKGPDFIDPAWITLSSGSQCYNLDMFLMTRAQIIRSFKIHASNTDIAVIEGNRGLYDGLDKEGSCSSAELAKTLGASVILIVDVSMSTRTVAALVKGCQVFDRNIHIGGVILNRVAGTRQKSLIGGAIERYCDIPVIGYIPKLKNNPLPERHMGLVPFQERKNAERSIGVARSVVGDSIDLDILWKIARNCKNLEEVSDFNGEEHLKGDHDKKFRIGVIRDQSFWFYYPENLDQLKKSGATLIEINSIKDDKLPDIDGLYIGGGFPETQAKVLANNSVFRNTLKARIEAGLPVYAECGGLLYLGDDLIVEDKQYPMVGALPIRFVMEKRPQGHGYTVSEVSGENPYFPRGRIIRGHEFHYTRAVISKGSDISMSFTVRRGKGIDGGKDGIVKNNLLATYTHIHAAGDPGWAESFIGKIRELNRN